MLFKILIKMHCIFIHGEGRREGVIKKTTLCTLLIMLIIMDDPLDLYMWTLDELPCLLPSELLHGWKSC